MHSNDEIFVAVHDLYDGFSESRDIPEKIKDFSKKIRDFSEKI